MCLSLTHQIGYEIIGHIGNIGRIAVVFPWGSKCPQNGLFCERADIEGKIDTLDAENRPIFAAARA